MPTDEQTDFIARYLPTVDAVLRYCQRRLGPGPTADSAARTVFAIALASDLGPDRRVGADADVLWLLGQAAALLEARGWSPRMKPRLYGATATARSALETLPAKGRDLLLLKYWDGLDDAAMASLCATPRWLLLRRLHRATDVLWRLVRTDTGTVGTPQTTARGLLAPLDPVPNPIPEAEARALLLSVEAAGIVLSDEPDLQVPSPFTRPRRRWLVATAITAAAVLVGAAAAGLSRSSAAWTPVPEVAADPDLTQPEPPPGPLYSEGPFPAWTRIRTEAGASFQLPPGWTTSRLADATGTGQVETFLQDEHGKVRATLFQASSAIKICYPGSSWTELDRTGLVTPLPGPFGGSAQTPAHVSLRAVEHLSGKVEVLAAVSNDPKGPVNCAEVSAHALPVRPGSGMGFIAFTTNSPLQKADRNNPLHDDRGEFTSMGEALLYAKSVDFAQLRRAMASLQFLPPNATDGPCSIRKIVATRNLYGITTAKLSSHPDYFTELGCADGWLAFEVGPEGLGHFTVPNGGLLFFLARDAGNGFVFDPQQDFAVMDGWASAAIDGAKATPAYLSPQQRMDAQFTAAGVPPRLRPALIGPGP